MFDEYEFEVSNEAVAGVNLVVAYEVRKRRNEEDVVVVQQRRRRRRRDV